MSSSTGVVSGHPTTIGVRTVTVTARGAGGTSSATFPWTVGRAGMFVPVSAARVLDTRTGNGVPAAVVPTNGSIAVQVLGRDGIPLVGVSSVVLNVTATAPVGSGYVTVYADGALRPATSNVNYGPHDTVPNLVVAPVGSDGKVRFYASMSTYLVADVLGYHLAGTPTDPGAFASLQPARVLDTRTGNGVPRRPVPTNATLTLPVAGRGGVPAAAAISAGVLDVTGSRTSGFVTAYPAGAPRPNASAVNFPSGKAVANLVVVPVGAGGSVDLYVYGGGGTDVVADVLGYYRAGPGRPPTPAP